MGRRLYESKNVYRTRFRGGLIRFGRCDPAICVKWSHVEEADAQDEVVAPPCDPCFKRGFPQPRLFMVFFPGFSCCLRMPETGHRVYLLTSRYCGNPIRRSKSV